jgi:iron complex outermembrane receptor protein|nr:TonB-dependent receptor [Sphingobium yanoikuyae]
MPEGQNPALGPLRFLKDSMRRLLVLTVAIVSSSFPAFARAAEPTAGAAAIIVTAQKIEQRDLDVPITLSVATGPRLRELGVTDIGELSAYVPGLNIQIQSPHSPGFVIRGITSDNGSAQQPPRVSVYYNGVDISRARGAYQGLFDLARIEVAKGPQATLFGTAATIGAVSLVPNLARPGFSAGLTSAIGNLGALREEGFLNIGSERISARLAGQWKKRDGYVPNLAPGQDDLYAQDQLGLRGALHFQPTESLSADLVLTYDRQRNSGTPFLSRRLGSTAAQGVFGAAYLGSSPASGAVLGGDKLGIDRHVYDVNLTVTANIADGWSFTTTNGYRRFNSREVFDADGSAAWYLEFAEQAKGWQASHEGRFTYRDDQWRAIFGWNAFIENGSQTVPFSTEVGTYLQCTANVIPGLGCVDANNQVIASRATALLSRGLATVIPYSSWYRNSGRNTTWSLFGDVSWKAAPRLELLAGARLLIEDRRSGYAAQQPNALLYGRPLLPLVDTAGATYTAKRSFAALLPRFSLLYHLSPASTLFATISQGRRSPAVELSAASGPVPELSIVPAETVWNYEAGLKIARGAINGAVSVYYDRYRNFQVTVLDVSSGAVRIDNAGSAGNAGVEAELDVRPVRGVRFFGNMAYTGARIDDRPANGIYAGDRFRLQPRWQASAGMLIEHPVSDAVSLFAAPNVTYRSKLYFDVPNSEAISQSAVTLINGRAGARLWSDRLEIAGFVRNLADKRYLLDAGNVGGSFGYPTFIPAEPRTFGIEISARY